MIQRSNLFARAIILVAAVLAGKVSAFMTKPSASFVRPSQQLYMQLDESSLLFYTNNMWISTIDADIANIPTDQFGLVFAGGIVSVMRRV